MNPYLSVIVPVYNVEAYLAQCIDSIIHQNFTDLEIILVNDGSTDSSPQICDEFAKKDSRIKVIHQQNAGVSVARNKGIETASGECLTFVDSDDWLDVKMYEDMCMITRSEQHSEIVMCDFINIKKNSKEEILANIRNGFYPKEKIIEKIYPTLLVTEDFGRIPIVSTCNCVFKRSLLLDNEIKFDSKLKFAEDYLFMAEVMLHAKSFYYLKGNYFYNYRQYDESRSKKFQSGWWENLLYLNKELKKLLKKNKDYDFTRQIKLQLLHSVLFLLNSIYKNKTIKESEKRKAIRSILHQQEVKDAFSDLSFEKQGKMLNLVLHLLKFKMVFIYLLFQRTLSVLRNE